MRKAIAAGLVMLVAGVVGAGLPTKPKFKEVGHSFQGNEVCIKVDEGRNLSYCGSPQKIQKCMDVGNGTCNAQLLDAGDVSRQPKLAECSPKPQKGYRPCDANEYKQYQFRYSEKGASNAVLY